MEPSNPAGTAQRPRREPAEQAVQKGRPARPQRAKRGRDLRPVRGGSLSDVKTPLADFFNSILGLFDLNDRLALIRSAIQARVMRQLDLVALWTDGHARGCDAQFLRAPLVSSFP